MTKSIRILISAVLFALLCQTALADTSTYIPLDPNTCNPPTPPSPGDPGYGIGSAFPSGIYWDPNLGFWFIPPGLWDGVGGQPAPIIAMIEEAMNPPPPRPDWAIFDMEPNGTYYYGGGWYNGHYFAEGYYLPNEIW